MAANQSMNSFVAEAQHIIATLSSHFSTTGTGDPWHAFMARLDTVESDLASEDETMSSFGSRVKLTLQELRNMHETTLDAIRSRLFLRRKTEKVQRCIENIMTIILKGSTLIGSDSAAQAGLQAARQDLHRGCQSLIALLHEQAGKTKSADDQTRDHTESFRTLASMLDFNRFYSRDHDEEDQVWQGS